MRTWLLFRVQGGGAAWSRAKKCSVPGFTGRGSLGLLLRLENKGRSISEVITATRSKVTVLGAMVVTEEAVRRESQQDLFGLRGVNGRMTQRFKNGGLVG